MCPDQLNVRWINIPTEKISAFHTFVKLIMGLVVTTVSGNNHHFGFTLKKEIRVTADFSFREEPKGWLPEASQPDTRFGQLLQCPPVGPPAPTATKTLGPGQSRQENDSQGKSITPITDWFIPQQAFIIPNSHYHTSYIFMIKCHILIHWSIYHHVSHVIFAIYKAPVPVFKHRVNAHARCCVLVVKGKVFW